MQNVLPSANRFCIFEDIFGFKNILWIYNSEYSNTF